MLVSSGVHEMDFARCCFAIDRMLAGGVEVKLFELVVLALNSKRAPLCVGDLDGVAVVDDLALAARLVVQAKWRTRAVCFDLAHVDGRLSIPRTTQLPVLAQLAPVLWTLLSSIAPASRRARGAVRTRGTCLGRECCLLHDNVANEIEMPTLAHNRRLRCLLPWFTVSPSHSLRRTCSRRVF